MACGVILRRWWYFWLLDHRRRATTSRWQTIIDCGLAYVWLIKRVAGFNIQKFQSRADDRHILSFSPRHTTILCWVLRRLEENRLHTMLCCCSCRAQLKLLNAAQNSSLTKWRQPSGHHQILMIERFSPTRAVIVCSSSAPRFDMNLHFVLSARSFFLRKAWQNKIERRQEFFGNHSEGKLHNEKVFQL